MYKTTSEDTYMYMCETKVTMKQSTICTQYVRECK